MLHYDETHRMKISDEDFNRHLLILKEEKRKCLKNTGNLENITERKCFQRTNGTNKEHLW
jgi:hypothetical protein